MLRQHLTDKHPKETDIATAFPHLKNVVQASTTAAAPSKSDKGKSAGAEVKPAVEKSSKQKSKDAAALAAAALAAASGGGAVPKKKKAATAVAEQPEDVVEVTPATPGVEAVVAAAEPAPEPEPAPAAVPAPMAKVEETEEQKAARAAREAEVAAKREEREERQTREAAREAAERQLEEEQQAVENVKAGIGKGGFSITVGEWSTLCEAAQYATLAVQ
jgi:uncharacterized membrane protein